jgi:hypothetical protein
VVLKPQEAVKVVIIAAVGEEKEKKKEEKKKGTRRECSPLRQLSSTLPYDSCHSSDAATKPFRRGKSPCLNQCFSDDDLLLNI